MDKGSRIQAALQGQAVDRVPLALWRHYHQEDRTPQALAQATLAMALAYDLDLVKLTPSGLYAVEDWAGSQIVYPGTAHDPPCLCGPAVAEAGEWRHLPLLDPRTGALGRELEALRLVVVGLAGQAPCLMTVFSPLTLAYKLAGERLIVHLREAPADLHAGLEIITQTVTGFCLQCLAAGAEGLFFATQLASEVWLSQVEYGEFGERYDRRVLDAVEGHAGFTVLHLHGREIFFDLANRYPIHAVSWHDQETAPSLPQARNRTIRAFMTGLDRGLLGQGPVAAIEAQVGAALAQTGGRGLILAPSCVIPTSTPPEHLAAVRSAVSRA
jgi:uroporphyrinogen decarboxylase